MASGEQPIGATMPPPYGFNNTPMTGPQYQQQAPGPNYAQPGPNFAQPGPNFAQPAFSPVMGVPYLGQNPTPVQCPRCQQQIITVVQHEVGTGTWLIALAICFFGGFFFCCLIPFCLPMCQDSIHSCPSCGNIVGRRNLI